MRMYQKVTEFTKMNARISTYGKENQVVFSAFNLFFYFVHDS